VLERERECVCVCVWVRERERVCVCVSELERERERGCVCVCVCLWVCESVCVCVCECVVNLSNNHYIFMAGLSAGTSRRGLKSGRNINAAVTALQTDRRYRGSWCCILNAVHSQIKTADVYDSRALSLSAFCCCATCSLALSRNDCNFRYGPHTYSHCCPHKCGCIEPGVTVSHS
jgi:hypothetical protein